MSAKKSQKRVTRDKGQRRATKPARKTAARAAPRPEKATTQSAPTTPTATPLAPAQDLAELVRAAVAAELATRAAHTAAPSAPTVSPSPFGAIGEKAVDQYTVRLTERERAVVELARTDRALWQTVSDLPPTVALRRLAWEGARALGLLDRLTAPAQPTAAASAA